MQIDWFLLGQTPMIYGFMTDPPVVSGGDFGMSAPLWLIVSLLPFRMVSCGSISQTRVDIWENGKYGHFRWWGKQLQPLVVSLFEWNIVWNQLQLFMSCSAETGIIIMNLNTFIMRREELDVFGSYPMYPVGKVKTNMSSYLTYKNWSGQCYRTSFWSWVRSVEVIAKYTARSTGKHGGRWLILWSLICLLQQGSMRTLWCLMILHPVKIKRILIYRD